MGPGTGAGWAAAAVATVADRLEELREHPRHLVLAALVAGLIAARADVGVVVVLAVAAATLAGRPPVAALACAAVMAGAVGGHLRLAALADSALPPAFGSTVRADVVLLEQPRPVRHGATALAQLRAIAPAPPTASSAAPPAASPAGPRAGGGVVTAAIADAARGERVMLRLRGPVRWSPAATGAVVRVEGRLRALGPFERHYARKGANAAITLEAAATTDARRGGVWRLVDDVRTAAERALEVGLPPAQAALLRGMVLGQDEALDDRTRDAFRDSGLAHVLAASGQNVALLLALALPLLTAAGLGLRARLAVAVALIALYVPLAGAGPSIQRAGVMGAATTVAGLVGRPASRWYALLLAAAATLAWNPRALDDPGWQLSFAAVVAIALAARPTAARLGRRGVPAPVADAVGMSFAATLGTAPLLVHHFDHLSIVSLAANVVAAPAIAPVMWLGMLAAAVGQASAALAAPLNAANAFLLAYVGAVAEVAAGLPLATADVRLRSPAALAAVYGALAPLVLALRSRNGASVPGVVRSTSASPSRSSTSITR